MNNKNQLSTISMNSTKHCVTKILVYGIFQLIPLYKGPQIPKRKAFFPSQLAFSRNFGFLRPFLTLVVKIIRSLKLRLYLLLYSKRTPLSHGLSAKISLKNGPPWAEIFAKMFLNIECQTKPQPHFVFLNYLGSGWSVFQTDF